MIRSRNARRYTRIAQVGAAGLGALAVLVGVADLPTGGDPAAQTATGDPEPGPGASAPEDEALFPVDFQAIADRFAETHNAPQPPEPVAQNPVDDPEPGDTIPVAPVASQRTPIQYLGMLSAGTDRAWGIIRHRGQQRLFRLGEELDGRVLRAIEADHIIVEEDGEEKRISIAPSAASSVTKVRDQGNPGSLRDRAIMRNGGGDLEEARRQARERAKAREEREDR